MDHVESISALRKQLATWRQAGERIAFVPTMGNLHAGHLQLVKKAKASAQKTVVSIFVNPMQFGEGEDFGNYPRTLEQDRVSLMQEGVDLLFVPPVEEIYAQNLEQTTRVEVPGLSDILCGSHRPGHFVGVTTVVVKLFNMVQPDIAVFGKKDYQQLFLIKRMVEDLAMPIEIIGVETMREPSGLAMSSRNGYLTNEEQERAAGLYASLCHIAAQIKDGEANFKHLQQQAVIQLKEHGFAPDYVEIRKREDLSVPTVHNDQPLVVLAAAQLGAARLIDNLEIV